MERSRNVVRMLPKLLIGLKTMTDDWQELARYALASTGGPKHCLLPPEEKLSFDGSRWDPRLIRNWRTEFCAPLSSINLLTEVVQPVGVGSILILLLHKLEVMGCLVGNHAWVLPTTVDNVTEALPRVFLHKELRWDILHFHHLCVVRKTIHSRHAHCHTAGCWH